MTQDTFEICRRDLFTDHETLAGTYTPAIADKVVRIRAMYNWFLQNPGAKDADFVTEDIARHAVTKPTAYDDLKVTKRLLPLITETSRDFHRWRYIEMILNTYENARKRGDTKTMERAATSYARYTKIDAEDPQSVPLDKILVQPFTATSDPRVLGIEPIPNLKERVAKLIEHYSRESADIEDIEFEPADLEEDLLFPAPPPVSD
ncbi:MAG: hypothetical protein HDS67_02285 [Bacteroidales bacterium]|nr:hypothetical protein [Bacteroidales bacterium]